MNRSAPAPFDQNRQSERAVSKKHDAENHTKHSDSVIIVCPNKFLKHTLFTLSLRATASEEKWVYNMPRFFSFPRKTICEVFKGS